MGDIMQKIIIIVLGLSLISCTTAVDPIAEDDDQMDIIEEQQSLDVDQRMAIQEPVVSDNGIDLSQRMAIVSPSNNQAKNKPTKINEEDNIPAEILQKRYSMRADNVPLDTLFSMFGRTYKLNIILEPDVTGIVSVSFQGLSLKKAMEAILSANNYYWEWDQGLIRVRKFQTRTFHVDYLRLNRDSSSSSEASINSGNRNNGNGNSGSGSSGSGSGSGSSNSSSDDDEITAESSNSVDFWGELEEQIHSMLSSEGSLIVNTLAGMIQVRDLKPNVERVEDYLALLKAAVNRQVRIEARIVEVVLNEDNALGIDWTRVDLGDFAIASTPFSLVTGQGQDFDLSGANSLVPPGGFSLKSATLNIDWESSRFHAILKALSEQGDVKVVSQPRLMVLNNHTAFIKVGTNQTFFTRSETLTPQGSSNTLTSTDFAKTVTEGVILGVTPQISEDGWIMLEILPSVTRIVGVVQSPTGDSNAPILDVKKTSTIVRVRNNQMIMLGGMIQDSSGSSTRKVPLLGDLPFSIGQLFRADIKGKRRSELIIFLNPIITHDGQF